MKRKRKNLLGGEYLSTTQKPLRHQSKRFLCYISNIPVELSQIHRECKTPQWGVFGLYHQLMNRILSV
jgi:hypothetical protein